MLVGCGSASPHDTTLPAQDDTCPSATAPERCRDLAASAATAGHGELAWAYTVLECESPAGAQCVAMWQSYAKLAPTQTDALNVLHAACDHVPAACEQLAAWHTERGHVLAAAVYRKRGEAGQPAQPRTVNALALATDLAATMHVSDAPRTDVIAQSIGHELRAPVARVAAAPQAPKAWPMHAASQGASSDACASTAKLGNEKVSLDRCVSEVKPLDGVQIGLLNRCSQAITVMFAGARTDHSSFAGRLRLDRYEAHSAGASHADVGRLTYAVCPDGCRPTSTPDDVASSWTDPETTYYCVKGPL
jgi:hypothetical protein